jgi:hypothetical protein
MTPRHPNDRHGLLLLADVTTLSSAEVLEKGKIAFDELVIGELHRALANRIGIASMILACCAADFLTTLLAGKGSTESRFRNFVDQFLPSYDAKRLILMRHGLVHEYAVPRGKGYAFSVGRERAGEHLQNGRIIVDVLMDDLAAAGGRLFALAETDEAIRGNVLRRLRAPGLVLMEPNDLYPADYR